MVRCLKDHNAVFFALSFFLLQYGTVVGITEKRSFIPDFLVYEMHYPIILTITLLATLTTLDLLLANGQLNWDDPSIADGPCVFPPGIRSIPPRLILSILTNVGEKYRLYLSMTNKAYYLWQYHKIKNTPAMTQTELDSLKPRTIFPNLKAIVTNLAVGTVLMFQPPVEAYKVRCIPRNLVLTNFTCDPVGDSPGSAPFGFGGTSIVSTVIWADDAAFTEWHCFSGDRQIFNVVSTTPTLTQGQIEANTKLLTSLGFNPSNFQFQTYS